jgi:hypothetical protein
MTEEAEHGKRIRIRFLLALVLLTILLAIAIVPQLVGIGRYKNSITRLVSTSVGRPVHLASVELRLLPRPEFVMTDLSVDEDPAFGAEPILHANTVTAAIRLLSLGRGRLEISQISVDEASVNLVRTSEGRWNLESLLRSATPRANEAAQGRVPSFPYLEATSSRVNLKNGLEKLPYSLVNADVSLWQENPGDWRLRLRGQPARTDVSLDLADTGIVRLEARLQPAREHQQIPIHVDVEWREAQLGQLSRLILGSDPGWRGDLTGELQLDGTTEAAQVKTRLSASGVHRAEFAPADAMDFDANCTFLYHYSSRDLENLACDSPLGEGHVKLAGAYPADGEAKLAIQLQKVPVNAGLDALRTLRNGIDESLEVHGTISGQLTYGSGVSKDSVAPVLHAKGVAAQRPTTKMHVPPHPGPLQGNLTVDGFRLSGKGLSQPIQVAKIVLEPANVSEGQPQSLLAVFSFPAGGTAPIAISMNLALVGYQLNARGSASLARLRELAHVVGIVEIPSMAGLAGDPATLDLSANGPWLPPPVDTTLNENSNRGLPPGSQNLAALDNSKADQLSGMITLHNANWKSDALASHVQLSQATLHLSVDAFLWDPIAFSYGPVKGTATLRILRRCEPGADCPPQLNLQFAELDAAALQAALLGAHQPDTVISTLIARISPSSPPVWPQVAGTVKADSLVLGPVKLQDVDLALNLSDTGAELTSFDAELLGGKVHGNGKITGDSKPAYAFDGSLEGLSGPAVCELLALQCTGGQIEGRGNVELAGFSDRELAASAKGTLHIEWRHGAFDPDSASQPPKALARFDRFTADATIDSNGAILHQGQIVVGSRRTNLDATVTFANPPLVSFAGARTAQSAKR